MEEAKKSVTPASFVCEKCKGTPSMDQIVQSVATYGLILLHDDKNTWLGFNCPLCEKPSTNIKKFKNEDINPFRFELENAITFEHADLEYRSFPFSFHHSIKEMCESPWRIRSEASDNQVIKKKQAGIFCAPENWTDYIEEHYRALSHKPKELEPTLAIWCYRDEDIEKLASYESESGLRAFPRYMINQFYYSEIDEFCWEQRLVIDRINEYRIGYKDTFGDPFEIVLYVIPNSKGRDLTKTLNFMRVLEAFPQRNRYITNAREALIKKAGITYTPKSGSFYLINNRNTISKVWDNFAKDNIQDLLKQLSEKFIDEYIALSKSIDFNVYAVRKFKEKYSSELVMAIESPIELQKSLQDAREYRRPKVLEAEKCFPGVKIISQNFAIDQLKIDISRLPKVIIKPEAFLILGERGTGKGLFAKAIHEAYDRIGRKGKYVLFDCGVKNVNLFESDLFGHVKGYFTDAKENRKGDLEEAENGTIFIDEIGNLPMLAQKAMLGFLQDWKFRSQGASETKNVNAMVVLATNTDLKAEIKNGNFRADLYDRISPFEFEIPPLRSRKEDIPILIYHFIKMHDEQRNEDHSLEEFTATSDCIKALTDFDWPGNVRQLEGVVKKIVKTRGGANDRSPIDVSDLPDSLFSDSESNDPVHSKLNELPDPIKKKYGRLPKDESILIKHEQDGMTRKAVAKLYGVRIETVIREYSKIRKKTQI